ncbi:MAG: hypothetical protein HRT36_07465 [Alphaproteobacteria bacterium]|nr:hypothetical protein [Alphaproteobacteria bacterium]
MPNSERMIESQGLHSFAHFKGPMNLFMRTGSGKNTHRAGKPRLKYEVFGLLAKKGSHGRARRTPFGHSARMEFQRQSHTKKAFSIQGLINFRFAVVSSFFSAVQIAAIVIGYI